MFWVSLGSTHVQVRYVD